MDNPSRVLAIDPLAVAIEAKVRELTGEGRDATAAWVTQARDHLLLTFPHADPDRIELALIRELTQSRGPMDHSLPVPVKAKRRPGAPPYRRDDRRAGPVLQQATSQLEQWLLDVQWRDQEKALVAVTVTALLRLDVAPSAKDIASWLSTPWSALVRLGNDGVPNVTVRRLDVLTYLGLRRLLETGSVQGDEALGASWLAAHLPPLNDDPAIEKALARQREAAASQMLARCEQIIAPWLPAGPYRLKDWIQAWRRISCSPFVNSLAEAGAATPLAPHSAMRWDLGKAPPCRPEPDTADAQPLALRPDTQPGSDGWLTPAQADAALAALQRQLSNRNGQSILKPAQALAVVQRYRASRSWGHLEQLVLAWIEARLQGEKPWQASSVVRYLSGLRKLVKAQGCTPLVIRDRQSGKLHANVDQWDVALEVVANDCSDSQALRLVAQFFQSLLGVLQGLEDVDLEILETLREASQPAAHVVSPSEFESAIGPLWNGGADGERAALAAALGFYLGLRREEGMKLLAADVLDVDAGLLQVRTHRTRRTKTRNATRRLMVRPWLPAHWWERLRDRAILLQQVGRDRAVESYLLAELHAPDQAPPDALVEAVVESLRAATGDGRLTFHSLRHSFCSWNVLRLAVHDMPRLRAYPAAIMAEPGLAPEALGAWMQAWQPSGAYACDGRLLHELSRMAGHGHPATTLRWYVHVADVIVRGATTLALPALRRETLWTLLRMTELDFNAMERRARCAQPDSGGPAHTPWAIHAELLGVAAAPAPVTSQAPARALAALAPEQVPVALRALDRVRGHPGDVSRQLRVSLQSVEKLAANLLSMRPWRPLTQAHQPFFLAACAALRSQLGAPVARRALDYWAQGTVRDHTRLAWDHVGGLRALLALIAPVLTHVRNGAHLHLELRPLRRKGRQPSGTRALAAARKLLTAAGISKGIVALGPPCDPFPAEGPKNTGLLGHRIVLRLGKPTPEGFAVERGLMAAFDAACLLR